MLCIDLGSTWPCEAEQNRSIFVWFALGVPSWPGWGEQNDYMFVWFAHRAFLKKQNHTIFMRFATRGRRAAFLHGLLRLLGIAGRRRINAYLRGLHRIALLNN